MPLYEYQCESCSTRFERIQKFADPPVETCPSCGGPGRSVLSSPAIQFKESGWYITDYAKKSSESAAKPAATDSNKPSESDSDSAAAQIRIGITGVGATELVTVSCHGRGGAKREVWDIFFKKARRNSHYTGMANVFNDIRADVSFGCRMLLQKPRLYRRGHSRTGTWYWRQCHGIHNRQCVFCSRTCHSTTVTASYTSRTPNEPGPAPSGRFRIRISSSFETRRSPLRDSPRFRTARRSERRQRLPGALPLSQDNGQRILCHGTEPRAGPGLRSRR